MTTQTDDALLEGGVLRCDLVEDDAPWRAAMADLDDVITRTLIAFCTIRESAAGDVSLLLTRDGVMANLNRDHRGKDRPTNVLSFPATPVLRPEADAPVFLGDIAMGWETVADEAQLGGRSVEAHFSHLLIHGILHLMGYDHQSDEEAESMEALEIDMLALLGFANPYLES
jgi:probable rRNA maturation factor